MNRPHRDEQQLFTELLDPMLVDDVRKWVQVAIKWGEPDTPLWNIKEPRRWQIEEFEAITDFLRDQKLRQLTGETLRVHSFAHSAGRGVGKTAFDMLAAYWFFSTRLGGTVIATANKEDQLKLNTWPELGVWHSLAYNEHWFTRGVMDLKPVEWFKEKIRKQLNIDTGYYQFAGELWDESRPSAFAGKHNRFGLMVTIQEASGLPSTVLNVIRGFFTDDTVNRFLMLSSNMRRNTGAFHECFHKDRNRYRTRRTDSRTVEGVNRAEADAVVAKHGEGSPEACAEVTGQDPGQSEKQFISKILINESALRELPPFDQGAPVAIGVDVARQGGDSSVIQVRKGRDARTFEPIELRGADNVQVAHKVVEVFSRLVALGYKPKIFVDVGAGTGVIDVLRSWGYKVVEVDFGSSADEPNKFRNKRAEMYARTKAWLPAGCIHPTQQLMDDLAGPEAKYSQDGDGGALILESKDSMRARGLSSPDFADALVLTFAAVLPREDLYDAFSARPAGAPGARIAEGVGDSWNPFDT